MTKISVILPIYNAGPHLSLSIASLLKQTHRDLRIIAIDDGSTDGSGRILEAAATLDSRVTPIFRENRGLIETLNEGIAQADTDIIARMDADDIAFPTRFAAQLAAFETAPKLGLLGTNFNTLFTDTRLLPAAAPILTNPGERAVLGRFCTSLRHPTAMFRRSSLGAADLRYDARYPHAEDFDLFRRLALSTDIAELPGSQLAYRLHSGSVSITRIQHMCATHLRILEESLERHYPSAATGGLQALVEMIDADTVDAAAEMIRNLDALAPSQPENERAAFVVGVDTTLYFIFALICRARAYPLAYRFIDQAHRWHSIRRRERAALSSPAAHLGMTLSQWQVDMQRLLDSRPLTHVLPGYAQISECAREIELAANLDGHRYAA